MRTPSPSYCRLDLAPPLADRFIFGVAPIDYGPVLLLMPFGFHLAMDTLPSGNCKRWLQVRLGCVQLSPSCPFRLLHDRATARTKLRTPVGSPPCARSSVPSGSQTVPARGSLDSGPRIGPPEWARLIRPFGSARRRKPALRSRRPSPVDPRLPVPQGPSPGP